jgi:membrane associated rhomboid family serine protease
MAIHERDWYRGNGHSYGNEGVFGLPWTPRICKRLILITSCIFLAQVMLTRAPVYEDIPPGYGEDYLLEDLPLASHVEDWCALSPQQTIRGQLWRLLTYAFCHSRFGVMHILFNMLFLWWFGKVLEQMYGGRELLLFYLSAAVLSGLTFLGISFATSDPTPAIGASGSVMALMMLYALHFPRQRIYLFFLVPIQIRWLVLLYFVYDLHPVLLALSGAQIQGGVAHAAHLGGMIFGFFYYQRQIRLEPIWNRLVRRRRRVAKPSGPSPQAYAPSNPQDQEMDRILEKVFDEGLDTLTEAEQDFLASASEEYLDG